ncbi:NAD(P)-binding domain-containing protein [Paenibacillus allorhizosphaerae]|uniref:2-hydroxy-3-oxopropionate reductase n=1 Tax=Paenibacillus allorhizosphaerae TaxID=2849866 RepID=A0ABM8VKF4_9BACL|nr:NAD(P)-binding domain-containing protein [Paenibacillus allorhizosphaerae]CAG7646935.1 2-hydroxy-3-oxopropionate reductase [Paenibacillus allorhizosphaerae]
MKSIGFIGLGTMGKPMAANLLKKGFSVAVYNRSAEKADDLVLLGARAAHSPVDAALEADVVITMLSTEHVVLDTVFGENGIVHSLRPGQTVIDCSTVSPETSRKLNDECAAHLVDFLDAPVAGSKPAAENGTLGFMVGGPEEALEKHRDVLEAMGTTIVYMGPAGSGSYAKLAHNTIVGINAAALVEGLSMAVKAGLDPASFLSIVQSGGANSKQAELKGPKIIDRDFSSQFSLGLMLKDLILAEDVTNRFRMPAPMLRAAAGLFQMGYSKGLGDEDLSSVVKCYEDWIHAEISGRLSGGQASENGERRKSARIRMNIRLHLSVYQWEQEGAFSGQLIDGTLEDLSDSGIRILSETPLARDMFIVIHFPQEADLPPVTARIIRIDQEENQFRYGCMLSGLSPHVRLKLEQYIHSKTGEPGAAY